MNSTFVLMSDLSPFISVSQSALPGGCPMTEVVHVLSNAGIEEQGTIFTHSEVFAEAIR